MLDWWAFALLVPAVFIALVDWRKGLVAMIVVAFLQDPARKLELTRPVYFTLLVGIVFAVAYLRAQMQTRFVPSQIPGWKHFLRTPFTLLLVLLAAQAVNGLVLYGNPVIVGIGALSYLAPLPALLAGYHFALKRGQSGIEGWLTWYLVAALIMLPSIMLEYAGVDWQVLGDVGEGFFMFQEDTILTAHSGFFRASEMAAWHTATAVCVLLLLSSMRRISMKRMVAVVADHRRTAGDRYAHWSAQDLRRDHLLRQYLRRAACVFWQGRGQARGRRDCRWYLELCSRGSVGKR